MTEFKRDKTIDSKTEHIETECGTLHLTLGFQEESIVEVRAIIGKSGICSNVMLDSVAKLMSIVLQSGLAKYKICEKFKKQFIGAKCNQGRSCVDIIAGKVVEQLEK